MATKTASDDEDRSFLNRLGYSQQLYRTLNVFQNFSFGFVQVQVLGGISTLSYGYGLAIGGPSVFIWSFIGGFLMSLFVAFSLAEISSTYPASGSVYNWSAQLVPLKWTPLASYVVGWSNFIGNVASDALQAFAFSNYFNALIEASGGELYSSQQTVGVSIAILFLWSLLNGLRVDKVGWVAAFGSVLQISAILIIAISLYACAQHFNPDSFVFESYVNYTGWQSQSYVCAIGLLSGFTCFSGYDGSAHLAEETKSAKQSTPYGIIYTVLATGICGIFYILALLYTMPSSGLGYDDVFAGPTLAPAINLFLIVCGTKLGLALSWLTCVSSFCGGFGSVAITGRMTYALMRDRALPYGDFFSKVHSIFQSPINAIMLVFFIDTLLLLLCLSTSGLTAFYSLLSITTVGFLFSYLVPIILKMIFPNEYPESEARLSLGRLSVPCGVISSVWLAGVICLCFLPTTYPVTRDNMNWLIVVATGTILLCTLNWLFNSRHHFLGPKRLMTTISTSENVENEDHVTLALEITDGGQGSLSEPQQLLEGTIRGLVIGKFWPFHRGHQYLLEQALAVCSSEAKSKQSCEGSHAWEVHAIVCYMKHEQPSGALRAQWIKELYPNVHVKLLEDTYNDPNNSSLWARLTVECLNFIPSDVFTSEDYGVTYCRYLSPHTRNHVVDKARLKVPISGTKVRSNPLSNDTWGNISAPLRAYYAARIVLVGAESVGKTTLSQKLAVKYQTNWVEEYGRVLTEIKQHEQDYTGISVTWGPEDFVTIVREQNKMEEAAARDCNKLVICDTDGFATSIWRQRYLGSTDSQIVDLFREYLTEKTSQCRFYLLLTCSDVPFVQDGTRDGEDLREWMESRFIEELERCQYRYSVIKGSDYADRQQEAEKSIDCFLREIAGEC